MIKVFTDGSCLGNGKSGSRGGAGVFITGPKGSGVHPVYTGTGSGAPQGTPVAGPDELVLSFSVPDRIYLHDKDVHLETKRVTNQRCELMAVYHFLEWFIRAHERLVDPANPLECTSVPPGLYKRRVKIVTDSHYVIGVCTTWKKKWFDTGKGPTRANWDIIEPLLELWSVVEKLALVSELGVEYVKAHQSKAASRVVGSDAYGNWMADKLAKEAAKKNK